MIKKITVSPVNSLLFMTDANGGTPPEPVWGAKIQSTPSCISFACFPEQDGPTEIAIGQNGDLEPEKLLVFDGELDTPSRVIILETAVHERVLAVDVAHRKTKVRIWYSHPKWPEKIVIGVE